MIVGEMFYRGLVSCKEMFKVGDFITQWSGGGNSPLFMFGEILPR